ncbi:fimbrial biogenesis outer membrane usher protein [Escherichia coli]|uniref:fimbria/pilus outer membrane usher protein n=1 Tax=Escherichia coli TaxID=562 RepID=UPI000BE472DA|nr:fimbria/pilus outer membrane usher protein [Escherichia coli]EEV7050338.1 fimbrial biogenesis outer membrane usher protein [Escherichia coli]EFH9652698.1 fimbrial biogenesis outer membrane usher protein [Escherichia coli]GDO27457.1 fimbrial usher protein [Escherichia coli]HAV9319248.1 fimbrial biogenesis outer membrane usher protein [Escherichia coli]HDC0980528.1 fimbrial biogenesis outer membrane usher protein [Escherichia coli]
MALLNNYWFGYSKLCVACILLIYSGLCSAQKKYEFDPRLLNSLGEGVDIDIFNTEQIAAGTYILDIYVNGDYKKTHSIKFIKSETEEYKITPCFDKQLLISLGVKEDLLKKNKEECDKGNYSQWKFSHNIYEQTLHINIPGTDLNNAIDGIAPKILWDDGISAAFLNYRTSASSIKSKINKDEKNYLHLDLAPGFNFGAWRLRNKTFYTNTNSKKTKWQNVNNYIERGIKEIDSRITIGDFITTSNLFNSLSLRGAEIRTDETMIPSRLRNNNAIIRGVAKTQAHVEVEYNGYVIYSRSVDAGIFEFNDLPNVGTNGVYKVSVFEADGTKNIIMIPFTQAPFSLRKGTSDYAFSFGRYRSSSSNEVGPEIVDAGYSYGLSEHVTVSAALQLSDIYEAYATGLSLNLGAFGAFSLEGAYATAKQHDKHKEEKKGGAVSLKYSKGFYETGTDLYLANHSYNSKHYKTINEVYESLDSGIIDYANRKHSTSVGLNQVLQNGGFRFSYNFDHYWDGRKYQYIDLSYQGYFKGITFSLGYNEYIQKSQSNNHLFTASVSVPFRKGSSSPISASYKYTNGNTRGENHSLGLSGAALDNTLSWNLHQKYNNQSYYGVSGNASWRNRYGYISVGASTDRYNSSYSTDTAGSLLISKHGLTFGQEMQQSNAILVAAGASDVPVLGKFGVKTNSQGKALVTGLQPYRENNLSLDPLQTPENVEILQTDIKVIPTNGAIVEGRFKTNQGIKSLVRIITSKHQNIPFGSVVTVAGNNGVAGIAGDNGEVFLTGIPESGVIHVKWGVEKENSCSVSFNKALDKNPHALVCK